MPRDVKAEEFEVEDDEGKVEDSPIITGEDQATGAGEQKPFDADADL